MTAADPSAIIPFGDRALRFALPPTIDRRLLLEKLRATPSIVDIILAEDLGAVVLADTTPPTRTLATLALALALAPALAPAPAPAHHVIPVAYDGPDLLTIATRLGLTPAAVIELHANRDYEVAMVGFLPGFAYLRGLDARLVVERRDHPRTRVAPGSVGIAAGYTGIYPFASPGGWHLLGEALGHRPFDANGAAFAVGDRVRFEPTERSGALALEAAAPMGAVQEPPPGAHLEVRKATGLALVVDRGRVGHMHEGVPHGGPMVERALAFANAAVGNDAGAAAIEVYGVLEVVARGGKVAVADDVRGRVVIEDGEVFAIATEGRARVRYLAVEGGVDVPVVLGGRGTLLVAGIGGYQGRGLRKGDRIGHAHAHAHDHDHDHDHEHEDEGGVREIAIVEGPDGEGVMTAIEEATFAIGMASDRTGVRLEGPALPSMHSARDRKSTPMVLGAIEMTPAGLVVLGPDHPTTGGYPVVGILTSAAIGRFFSLRIGARLRLRKLRLAGYKDLPG